jgi:hypothetical protein
VRNEAALCLGLAGVIQLAHPLVLRDDDGTVRVLPPDLHLAMVGAGLLTAQWKALARRTPDVMGHRCALYPRATTTPDGAMVMGGPLLVEGGNATDRLTRAVTSWLLTVAPEDVAVTVDGTVVTEAADGAVDAPAHATVVARAGARVTVAPPGWVPPVPADGRVSTPEWSWDAEPVDQDGAR